MALTSNIHRPHRVRNEGEKKRGIKSPNFGAHISSVIYQLFHFSSASEPCLSLVSDERGVDHVHC